MSKIALNSNASGTGVFTIASPNSDTDRTLTLPDESGDFVLSASGVISNFTSTGIDDNATFTAITIDSNGHAIIPAGVTLGTSAGVYNANNTLDDYEEGTWTPTCSSGSIQSVAGAATYVKVGKLVTAYCRIKAFSDTSSSNFFRLSNLPFVCSQYEANIGDAWGNAMGSYRSLYFYNGLPNTSAPYAYYGAPNSAQYNPVYHFNLSAGTEMLIKLSYISN